MSDSTSLHGRLTFSRPLVWREYRDLLTEIDSDDHVLALTETREEVDTDDGPMLRRTAVGIEPRLIRGDTYGRGAETELGELARTLDALGVETSGWLYRTSADSMERMQPVYGRGRPILAAVETALTVWPDGTSAKVPVKLDHGWFVEPGNGPAMFETPAVRTLAEVLAEAKG